MNVEHWDCINEKTATLAIQQSELVLKEQINTAQSIQNRADKLMTIITPVLTSLLVYLFSGLSKWNDLMHINALIAILIFTASLFFVLLNFRKYKVQVPGEYPENILNDLLISKDDKDDVRNLQYINVALHICQSNKKRIEDNVLTNTQRLKNNDYAFKILVFLLPLTPLIAFISTLVFEHCF